jgi:EAL domain-containing protein (putative c-di-GMP-specific phosphodiesterase class I)
MAKSINMNVVAEGVETENQLDYLLDKGCDCIQGYLFSKPLEEEEVYKFLDNFKG